MMRALQLQVEQDTLKSFKRSEKVEKIAGEYPDTFLIVVDKICQEIDALYETTLRKRASFFKLTKELDHFDIAASGLSSMLGSLAIKDSMSLVSLSGSVSKDILSMTEFIEVSRSDKPKDVKDSCACGIKIVDLILTATSGIFRHSTDRDGGTTTLMIHKGSKFDKFAESCGLSLGQVARKRYPMVCTPDDWTDMRDGGYLSNHGKYLFPLVKRTPDADRPIGDTYFNGVNHMQKTPFRVNEKILDVGTWLKEKRPLKFSKVFKEDKGRFQLDCPIDKDDHSYLWEKEDGVRIIKKTGKEKKCKVFVHNDEDAKVLRGKFFEWADKKDQHRAATEAKKSLDKSFDSTQELSRSLVGLDLYWPLQADRRYRTYPSVMSGINLQGADYQKAIVEFSNCKALGSVDGVYAIMKTLCNHWGNDSGNGIKTDKLCRADTEKWMEKSSSWIRECAINFKDNTQWMKADKPLQFLAAAFEWNSWIDYQSINSDFGYMCRLCDPNDASCSGAQILSAITRDPIGASHTNLMNKESQDLYMAVAGKVLDNLLSDIDVDMAQDWLGRSSYLSAIEDIVCGLGHDILSDVSQELIMMLHKDGLNNQDIFLALLNKCDKIEISRMSLVIRNLVKKPVMVKFYSGTKYGNGVHIKEFITKQGWTSYFREDKVFVATYMGNLIYNSINQVISGAGTVMDWFIHVAGVFGPLGLPLSWRNPIGCKATLAKYATESVKIKLIFQGKERQLSVQVDKLKEGSKTEYQLDTAKMKSSVAPDIVHSLDAALVLKVSARCAVEGVDDLWMVHDSLATHCADTVKFNRIIREEFINLFGGDVLQDLYDDFLSQLSEDQKHLLIHPQTYGIQRGDYDIQEVLESEFCFK